MFPDCSLNVPCSDHNIGPPIAHNTGVQILPITSDAEGILPASMDAALKVNKMNQSRRVVYASAYFGPKGGSLSKAIFLLYKNISTYISKSSLPYMCTLSPKR
jgi:hypothetical protein